MINFKKSLLVGAVALQLGSVAFATSIQRTKIEYTEDGVYTIRLAPSDAKHVTAALAELKNEIVIKNSEGVEFLSVRCSTTGLCRMVIDSFASEGVALELSDSYLTAIVDQEENLLRVDVIGNPKSALGKSIDKIFKKLEAPESSRLGNKKLPIKDKTVAFSVSKGSVVQTPRILVTVDLKSAVLTEAPTEIAIVQKNIQATLSESTSEALWDAMENVEVDITTLPAGAPIVRSLSDKQTSIVCSKNGTVNPRLSSGPECTVTTDKKNLVQDEEFVFVKKIEGLFAEKVYSKLSMVLVPDYANTRNPIRTRATIRFAPDGEKNFSLNCSESGFYVESDWKFGYSCELRFNGEKLVRH